MEPLRHRNARLYSSIRTAHLERARALPPASIVYQVRRYDFDPALAEGLDVRRVSTLGAALLLRRSRLSAIEVNEPLMLSALPLTVVAVAAVRLFRPRSRPMIVTYAIGNEDPFDAPIPSWRTRVRRWGERRMARWLWRRVDRVAFGTSAARDTYAEVIGRAPTAQSVVIPALPAAPATVPSNEPGTVVFLGDFSARKGIPDLLQAWDAVAERHPGARLTLIGKGALLDDVEAFERARDEVDLIVDPPRAAIRRELDRASVLVLPSRPTATWREQVGLPIVEGLESGCAIVTSTETGLAQWLEDHGHDVFPGGSSPEILADALVRALDRARPAADVVADLPPTDGRLDADRWLFERGASDE